MNDTKDIRDFYRDTIKKDLTDCADMITQYGYSDDTLVTLRLMHAELGRMLAAESFVNAWHEDKKC